MVRKSCVPNLVKIGPYITPESHPQVPERLFPVHTWVWIESMHAWTSDIGHRTRKWFYILSNAAIHSIGQTTSICDSTSISRIQRPLKACFRLLHDDDDDDDTSLWLSILCTGIWVCFSNTVICNFSFSSFGAFIWFHFYTLRGALVTSRL